VQYRQLGQTGEEVSVLGFGCMRLPVIDGDETCIDEPQATRMLDRALELGVNYVDTAWPYHGGHSEPWLGRALAAGGRRERVLIATKLPVWDLKHPDDCERIFTEQLRRLQTDRIDCYLLHNLNRRNWRRAREKGALDFLDRQLAQGRIRYAGFSFHDDPDLFAEIVAAREWFLCQIQLNYMDERYQAGTEGMRLAAGRGLGVIVMEPLRGGKLAALPDDIQRLFATSGIERTPAAWALRWVWDQPEVSLALSGMGAPAELEENAATASAAVPGALTAAEYGVIDRVRTRLRERMPVPCTVCRYCLPCPEGVNIPKIFNLYNNAALYQDVKEPAGYYTMIMLSSERADRCVECGTCVELCPQQIDIPAELARAHELFTKASQPAEGD